MRINFSDDEERPGQFALWNANVVRSLKGRAGQVALRELEAALVALPEKRLIRNYLIDDADGVCAVGCYARAKGLDLKAFDRDYETDAVGVKAGMPRLVAWEVVAQNDIYNEGHYKDGDGRYVAYTPEERYERVLAWVREQLKSSPEAPPQEPTP